MRRLLLLFIFLLNVFCFINTSGQNGYQKKLWKAKISLNSGKIRGQLYSVSDSSVILQATKNMREEALFRNMRKIRLVSTRHKTAKHVLGFITGAALGAWGTSSAMTRNKEGEPAAMSGVVGGIGGGIGGGLTGLIAIPALFDLISSKKIIVRHDSVSYQFLKIKLQRFCKRP